MIEYYEVAGPYAVASLMSIGAVCVFIWGVLSGAFTTSDEPSIRFYRREVGDDEV